MDLVLVRHAEPERIEGGGGRPADPGLTDRGHEQAGRLAAWLAQEHFDAVLASPQRRAQQTATPLAGALGLAVETVAGLAEYDWRSDTYIPIEELRAAGDPRWDALVAGRWDELGADAPEAFHARVRATVDEIVARFAGRRVAAVCHGGVVNAALGAVLDLGDRLWFEPAYASIHRVVASRRGPRSIVSVNETAHLEVGHRPRRPAP